MYQYKFYRIQLSLIGANPKEDYKQIVRDHAYKGWRLVQIFAPVSGFISESTAQYFELIFEREVEETYETIKEREESKMPSLDKPAWLNFINLSDE